LRRAIGLIVLGLAGCGHQAATKAPPIPVGVAIVTAAEIRKDAPTAVIESSASVDLASGVGGHVRDILTRLDADGLPRPLRAGDQVTAGTVLARVSESGYAEKVSQAEVHLAEARVEAVIAKQNLDGIERSAPERAGRESDLRAARLRLETALARVDAVLKQVDESRAALDAALIRAPIDGVVVRRLVDEGKTISPGTICFLLGDTSSLKAVFRVTLSQARDLKVGGKAMITVPLEPIPPLNGLVSRIDPRADDARGAFDVELAIPNTKRLLTPGMIVSLKQLRGGMPSTLVAVPVSALIRSGSSPGADSVMVVEERDGTMIARARGVKLGETMGEMVDVTEGLQPGESVIVQGAALARDGGAVEVVPLNRLDPAPMPTSGAAAPPKARRSPRKA
jgi:membrane fusion protein (multidrug efflux system)